MRKALLIIAIVVLALVPFAAYMLIVNTPARVAVSTDTQTATTAGQELTEQQQADLKTAFQKMVDLKKETINTLVQDGLMTKEQGDRALERLDQMVAYYAENGFAYGNGAIRSCLGGNLPRAGYDADDGFAGRGGMMRGLNRGWN